MNRARILIVGCLVVPALLLVVSAPREPELILSEVELADTQSERAMGLMNRTNLCPTCAMLFTYGHTTIDNFWMKDTPLPLDILMIDSVGRVITIHRNTTPFSLERLAPEGPYQYALEVNAGKASNLNVGDRLNIELLKTMAH